MKKTLIALVAAMILTACGPEENKPVVQMPPAVTSPVAVPAPTVAQQPQVVVQQADNGTSNAILGAAAGFALGSMMNNNSRPVERDRYYDRPVQRTTVIEKHYYNAPKPEVKPPVAAPVPAAVKPALQPSPATISPSKIVPNETAKAPPSAPAKLSLAKPASTPNNSFGGFNRRK